MGIIEGGYFITSPSVPQGVGEHKETLVVHDKITMFSKVLS